MTAVKHFDEFIRRNVVKKQLPDKSRAKFLVAESEKSRKFLKAIVDNLGINDETANNIIKISYDILMELVRSKMLLEGYNASGQGAHEAEVSYLRVLGFSENEVQFADQLRYFRNGMTYYGRILNKEYANKVLDFLDKTYTKLKQEI